MLLGHENDTEASFADLFEKLVGTYQRSGAFADGESLGHENGGGLHHEMAGALVGLDEFVDLRAKPRVTGADLVEIRLPVRRIVNVESVDENRLFEHGAAPMVPTRRGVQ